MSEATSLVDVSPAERRLAERIDPSVTGGLSVSDAAGGLSFRNAGEVMEFAKMMAVSNVAVPKHLRGNPGACLAVAIQALEWRLSPYAVANKSYSVNDRLAYESQLIQAVILQRAPIVGRFKVEYRGDGANRVCIVSAKLRDGSVVDYTSPRFSDITPKNSPLWKSDPDQQQFYYSGRALCRRHFPDVLLGIYDRDELEPEMRGPETARDVTPRTLSGRLDALAASPAVHHTDPEPNSDAAASSPAATERAEAGATSSPRRASANPKKAMTADDARKRGAAEARAGVDRSEVPEDVDAAGLASEWLAGFDEAAARSDDDSFPGDE